MEKSILESNKNHRYLYLSIGLLMAIVIIVFYVADIGTKDNSTSYFGLGLVCMFWSRALEEWGKLKSKDGTEIYFKLGYWGLVAATVLFFAMTFYE